MRLKNLKPYKLSKAIIHQDDELNQSITGYEEIGVVHADIQPCRGVVKAQLYGSEITKYLSTVMHPNTFVKEGVFIEYEGVHYEVQSISKWSHWSFDMKAVI